MHAMVTRNDDAFPPNRNAWKIRVYDEPIWPGLLYDSNVTSKLSFEQQLVMSLGPYVADPADVHRVDGGYRIENVRRRT